VEKARRALASSRSNLLSLRNVVGVGVGYKERRGESTGRPSVVVLVRRKVARGESPAVPTGSPIAWDGTALWCRA